MDRTPRTRFPLGLALWAVVLVAVWWVAQDGARAFSTDYTGWLVRFEDVVVAPVDPSDTGNLVDAGVLETDGFKDVVLSIGGEMKSQPTKAGKIGVLLVPDMYPFDTAFERGRAIFTLANTADVSPDPDDPIFESEQVRRPIAFSRYRVFLYNTTDAPAGVWVYAYRTR